MQCCWFRCSFHCFWRGAFAHCPPYSWRKTQGKELDHHTKVMNKSSRTCAVEVNQEFLNSGMSWMDCLQFVSPELKFEECHWSPWVLALKGVTELQVSLIFHYVTALFSNDLPDLHWFLMFCLQDDDWRARESAILALGAISEGCAQGLLPYLADMINMLLPMLEDPRPLVRSISCWALSRYSRWTVSASRQNIQLAQAQCDLILEVSPVLWINSIQILESYDA